MWLLKLVGMWHLWEMSAMYSLWWGNMKERDYLDGLGVDARIILKGTLKNSGCA
jgi:hypothetical protein